MARKGFFSRLTDTVRRVLRRTPEPPPQPPQPPPPPVPPPRPPGTGGGGILDPYGDIWRATVDRQRIADQSRETGYSQNEILQAHLEVFLALPGIVDEDNQERYRLWRLYVEIMVNPGHKRNDPMNGFWGELGIAPRDFDWEDWRDAMGYSKY